LNEAIRGFSPLKIFGHICATGGRVEKTEGKKQRRVKKKQKKDGKTTRLVTVTHRLYCFRGGPAVFKCGTRLREGVCR